MKPLNEFHPLFDVSCPDQIASPKKSVKKIFITSLILKLSFGYPGASDLVAPDNFRHLRQLTLKRLGHFFKNVILFHNVVLHKCDIFYMKLVQYNECLVSILDTDGLVL